MGLVFGKRLERRVVVSPNALFFVGDGSRVFF